MILQPRFSFRSMVLVLLVSGVYACNNPEPATADPAGPPPSREAEAPLIAYSIVKTYPHDPSYFTEGLEFHDGKLLESSGGNAAESPYPSAAGIANLSTGKIDTKIRLDAKKYFGEGITVFRNTLYQLTWQSGVGFKYDSKTFQPKGSFTLPTREGWGLTHDSSQLIMSDGTSNLYFINPENFQIKYTVTVTDHTGPISNINELEYVNGVIYANRWETPYILRIDPKSGKVTGRIDFSAVVNDVESKYPDTHFLNGIAFNPATGNLVVTGKNWPSYYEIKLQ